MRQRRQAQACTPGTQILRQCRHAMGANGHLVLVEALLPEGNGASPTKNVDIQLMLTNAGGRIHSETQWRSLSTKPASTGRPSSQLEASPMSSTPRPAS